MIPQSSAITAWATLWLIVGWSPIHGPRTLAGEPTSARLPHLECFEKDMDANGCAAFMWRLTNLNIEGDIDQFWIDLDAGEGGRDSTCRGYSSSTSAWTPPPGWTVTNCTGWEYRGQTGHALFRFTAETPADVIGIGETVIGFLTVDANKSREYVRPDSDYEHTPGDPSDDVRGTTVPAFTVLMSAAQVLGNEGWARCDGAPEAFLFGPAQGGSQQWSETRGCQAHVPLPAAAGWARIVLLLLLLAGGIVLVRRSRRPATVGALLIAALLVAPTQAEPEQPATAAQLIAALELDAIPRFDTVGPGSSAFEDLEVVWDNAFEYGFGFLAADQCASLYCGVYPPGVQPEPNDPIALLANDIFLPADTIVSAIKTRFTFYNPAEAHELEGVVVTFWENDPSGGPEGQDFPMQPPEDTAVDDILDPTKFPFRFAVAVDDPGFTTISEGGFTRRIEVEFNAGEQYVSETGSRIWVTITPVLDFPPQTFSSTTQGPGFLPAVQSFDPPDAARPWQQTPEDDPVAEFIPNDTQFQLFGQRPRGGSTVVRMSGTASCTLDVVISNRTAPILDCNPGACTTSDAIGWWGGDCIFSVAVSGSAAAVAAAIEDTKGGYSSDIDVAASFVCGDVTVTLNASGEYLIVTTDDGPRPFVCVSDSGESYKVVGGEFNCVQDSCNLTWQVGLQAGETLPDIPAGQDHYQTIDECALADPVADADGTWKRCTFPASLFDRPGLPPASTVTSPTGGDLTAGAGIGLLGVARAHHDDETDFIVERLENARFGKCTCDLTDAGDPGGTTLRPDGFCDASDQASFDVCLTAQTPDCVAIFDYDRDGSVDSDNDLNVFNCLLASGVNDDCCPPTFNGDPGDPLNYPRTADVIPVEVRRLHLRGCDPIEVGRTGQESWPESWWVNHYLSARPPRVGAGDLGDCTGNVESEPNNVLTEAIGLGLVARSNPVRYQGNLGSIACDLLGQSHLGQRDPDVYTFDVAFGDLVSISVRGRGTPECCDGLGDNCDCGPDLAVTSVWLFDESGSSLLSGNDPGTPPCDIEIGTCDPSTATCEVCGEPGCCCCSPIVGQTRDPIIETVLPAGRYTLVVGSAALIVPPNPVDADGCAIGGAGDFAVPNEDEGPATGDYELNVVVSELSTMVITQTSQSGGTFDQRLLVQGLTTIERLADPFATILIDTGALRQDADILNASGPWTNLDVSGLGVIPGAEEFVPGVLPDASAAAAVQQSDLGTTFVHKIEPPRLRDCPIIEDHCAQVLQFDETFTASLPFDVTCGDWRETPGITLWHQGSSGTAGDDDGSDLNYPSTLNLGLETADDFTFFEDVTIESVRWSGRYSANTPEETVFPVTGGDKFTITFYTDDLGIPGTPTEVYFETLLSGNVFRTAGQLSDDPGFTVYDYYLDLGPAGLNDPFVASANTTYWISIVQNLRGTPHTWFWAEADSGDVNGRSAVRERVDTQWSLSHAATDDHAFDLLSTGTSTVYAAKSVDAASAAYTATGLGYYFDSNQAYISGFRPEDEPGAEFDMTHWRGVRAPWKRFGNIAVTPVPADADGAAAAFAEAGIAITEDEINALVDDADGLIIQGVFEGLAAFDANDAIYGVDVGGRIDRLCNQQVIDEVAPSDALNERLQVKGVRMTGPPSPAGEQVARAVLEPIAAPECFFDFECFPRPNVCYTPRCRDQAAVDRGLCSADEIGTCFVMPRGYGDVNEDGIGPKVFDIIAQLAVIGEGGDTEQATAEQADIHPCDGNGTVNVQDIFAALDVLEGIDVCCGQYSPFACCVGDTCTLAQRADCETAGGLIAAGVTSCTPNPCPLGSAPAGDRSFEFAGRSAQHCPVPVEIKLVPEAR